MSGVNRRTFLMTTGATAVGLASSTTSRAVSAAGRLDANNQIRVAVLGVNGRGTAHISSFEAAKDLGATVTMLCDPDRKVLEKRATEFESKYGRKVETEIDLRKVFDRKDIDVVTVATPNHWHALATIWACQADKDVYVEKPGSHNIFEGRQMVKVAAKTGRIVQHGVQLRSSEAIREAVDHLRNGTIGKVYMARGLVYRWRPSIGHKPDLPQPPAHLDWSLWQGPAQERAFSERLVHYNWHWHWDYGNGDLGNQGVHQTDMCLWGLGVELPTEITAMGGKFLFDDDKETPEQLTTLFKFPNNTMIQFEVRPWITNDEAGVGVGNIFYGSEGYLVINGYNSYQTFLGKEKQPGPKGKDSDPMNKHVRNFLEAVRSRNPELLHGPVETAHTSSALAHLGNIAYRLGRTLKFDPATERFVGDAEANTSLTRSYRAPFVVPETV
jgi:predicted dehydrogenase